MKVTLPRGIASLSGIISRNANQNLVAKTYRKADGTKETRMYWMPKQQRTTPVSDKENANRNRFTEASLFYQTLTPDQRTQYAQEMKKKHYSYNGKKYSTLRGYIIARHFHNDLLP